MGGVLRARKIGVSVVLAFLVYKLWQPSFSAGNLESSLQGQIAVVTGGSRGIGKGIAVALGEAGAVVYVTGRTLRKGASNTGGAGGKSQDGSLEETCDIVAAVGGKCIPVAVDNADDKQLEALFQRVVQDHGKVDVLVNNAFSAVSYLPTTMGKPFWEKGVEAWDEVNQVGLRSHYVASVYAARHMVAAKQGVIFNIGSFGGSNYIFDVSYGIGKAAMDRMANDMAVELGTDNVTMVSIWPGTVKTENMEDGVLTGFKERRGMPPGAPALEFKKLLATPLAETPLFVGRAVAAFARDRQKQQHTGKILLPPVLAAAYGLVDERGARSPPMTSLKFLISLACEGILRKLGIFELSDGSPGGTPELPLLADFYWNRIPDFAIPGFLLKLGAGAPNLSFL